jgi:hypothetical protein
MVRNNEKIKPGSPEGTPASQETRRPMAVREITIEDKVEAMEARVAALEKIVDEHQRYHFGRKP